MNHLSDHLIVKYTSSAFKCRVDRYLTTSRCDFTLNQSYGENTKNEQNCVFFMYKDSGMIFMLFYTRTLQNCKNRSRGRRAFVDTAYEN